VCGNPEVIRPHLFLVTFDHLIVHRTVAGEFHNERCSNLVTLFGLKILDPLNHVILAVADELVEKHLLHRLLEDEFRINFNGLSTVRPKSCFRHFSNSYC